MTGHCPAGMNVLFCGQFTNGRNVSKPALVIELKFNNSADTAIDQIKRKQYPAKIAEYTGDILLVGVNYEKETKQHTCKIERI